MSSISTLKVAWEHKSLWSYYLEEKMKQISALELLKRINSSCSSGIREEKQCDWDEGTIRAATRQGNLEMVKYCVANECPIDNDACAYAAENGHLEMPQILTPRSKAPWGFSYCR